MISGCTENTAEHVALQVKLNKELREVSGLAQLSDGRLLAVADEQAVVYAINMDEPSISEYARFGDKPAKADIEGIAVIEPYLYLVSSDGMLWQQRLNSKSHSYETHETEIGKLCEVEGLAELPNTQTLMILCKTPYHKSLKGQLSIFAWSTTTRQRQPDQDISIALASLGLNKLHPSGLSIGAQGLQVVAAKQARLVEIAPTGELIRSIKLPKAGQHRQTEGIVIDANNRLYLADEGGKGKGTITRYDCCI